jgi:predicted  nucleic acid-binding Zn-ribbon protein
MASLVPFVTSWLISSSAVSAPLRAIVLHWRALSLVTALALTTAARGEDKITYDDHISPLLRQHCGSCHNPTARKSGLDVTNFVSLMEGGASGAAIEPGDSSASYLFSLVAREAEPFMPPNSEKIPDAELDLLRSWIDGGALENAGSKAMKPKAGVNLTVEVDPGARPEVMPMPPRMVLEPHYIMPRPPMSRSLATSPWAPLVAVASQRQVLLYHSQSRELLGVFAFPEGQPNVLRFSRDGRLLLAGGGRPAASGKVVVWDITTGQRVFEVGDELDAVLAADISADYQRIALGGPQRLVRVYSTQTGQRLYEHAKHTEWVTALEFSPDGVLLATGDRNGGLHLWEAHTGNEYLTLNGHTAAITAVSWRGDSNVLASASEDGSIRIWELENGKQIKTWNAKGPLLSLEFARDGKLVSSGRDQITRLWDQQGKQLVETPPIGDVAVSVSYCDETNRIIAASWAGEVQLYQAADAAALGGLATNPPTLAERLAAAEKQLQQHAAASAPLAGAVQKAEQALAPVASALAAAQQQSAALETNAQALAAEVKQFGDLRAAREAERAKLVAQLDPLQQAQPLVAEALRHLTEALGKAPTDATITEAHRQLTEKLQAMEASIGALRAKSDESAAAISAEDAKLQDASARLEAARMESAAAAERVKSLEAESQQLAAAVDAAQKAAAPAVKQLADAQGSVERWRGEIAFRDQMAALAAELAAAREEAAKRQADVDQANQQLAAAKSAAEVATAKLSEASQGVGEVEAKIDAARAAK